MAAPTQNDDWLPGPITTGPDTIHGLNGNDTMAGGLGNDKLYGDGGNDTIYGGDFGSVAANNGNDLITGGTGNDFIYDFGGNNHLAGGPGDDWIIAGNGSDDIWGDDGTDIIFSGGGDDVIYVVDDDNVQASTGTDEINFSFLQLATGVRLNLGLATAQATGAAGTLTVTGVEDLYGTWKNDIFTGNSVANFLDGASGNDTLFGLGGNDKLWGWLGDDTLNGGLGNDTLKGFIGRDTFVFNTAPNSTTNKDFIDGFSSVDDVLKLSKSVFTKLGALGALNADAFIKSAFAQDAEDRILYDQARGHLYYDADGTGTLHRPIMFAYLQPNTFMALADFTVIA